MAAVVTGLIATLAGADWPALRAGRISPMRAVLGERATASTRHRLARALAGVALFVPGAVFGGSLWMSNNTNGALNGIIATLLTMGMFVGMVLAAPVVITPLVGLLHAAVAVAVAHGWPDGRRRDSHERRADRGYGGGADDRPLGRRRQLWPDLELPRDDPRADRPDLRP